MVALRLCGLIGFILLCAAALWKLSELPSTCTRYSELPAFRNYAFVKKQLLNEGTSYGGCGYTEAPHRTPQLWSPDKYVVLRSVHWDSRQMPGYRSSKGFWVFLVELEKRILSDNLIVGVQVGNVTSKAFEVIDLRWNRYINSVCGQLSHTMVLLRSSAPSIRDPIHGAVLFRARRDGCIQSAISEQPVLTSKHVPAFALGNNKRSTVVTCLAPGYGVPKHLAHFLRQEKIIGTSHVHMTGDETLLWSGALDNTTVRQAIDEGFLSVTIWPKWFSMWQIFYHSQLLAYQDCLYRYQGVYDYIFAHDSDDFFVPLDPKHKTIEHYISRYCPRGTCCFSWEEFNPPNSGLTGEIGEDGNITDKIVAKHSRIPRAVYKCVHRTQDLFEIQIHGGSFWKQEGYVLKTCCSTTLVPQIEAYVAHVRY